MTVYDTADLFVKFSVIDPSSPVNLVASFILVLRELRDYGCNRDIILQNCEKTDRKGIEVSLTGSM